MKTTKKDKEFHGIGLKSIKRIVEKYQGEFELEFKEKEVEATVLLLNVQPKTFFVSTKFDIT